jgi:hypothetical protein
LRGIGFFYIDCASLMLFSLHHPNYKKGNPTTMIT